MRVALVNHGTASEWGGGDTVQIQETAKRLRQRGHKITIQNSDTPNLENCDIAHIFNSRVSTSFIQQIATCKRAKVPVVVSPIWISIGRAMWGSRGVYGLLRKGISHGEDSIKRELELLKQRKLTVQLDGGNLDSDGRGTYDLSWQTEIAKLLNNVDGILPNSWLELKNIQRDLNWSGQNFEIAHYGVDPKIFLDADPKPFRELTGIDYPFVMQAGRIEAGKNQAMLCWALKNTDMRIVLIGGTKHWPAYANLCKEISGDKLKIIDHLPQEMLASAYAAARVHCLGSWMDTCGLVSLEAALNGTPLVGSTFGHELEYLQGEATLVDPGDPDGFKKGIEKAWMTGKNGEAQQKLKQRILGEYNWEKTTTKTEKLYRRTIENS